MNKANQNKKNIEPRQVTLYRNVFYSRVSTAVVLLLLCSFLLQPIERIYASENTQLEQTSDTIMNLAVDANLQDTEIQSVSNIVLPVTDDATVATTTDESVVATQNVDTTEVISNDVATTTDEHNSEDSSSDIVDSTATTSTTTVFTDEEIKDLITPADELPETVVDELGTTTATSTDIPVAISTVNSDAVMQFNRNDCVTVEDGSFYCQSKKEEAEQGTDGMYALQDKDGDLEIFLQKNGELSQLTFNTVDDAAPAFDAKSNSIVWHRLVNERYQIISYDIDKKEEIQLTADDVNNMEPSRSGNNTVWQRWNNNNWDIVLYDGRETKYISDSPLNDIAPNIKGDLVMWNRLSTDNTQTIELYDIVTGEYTTITDEEGGALSNPRMVLVYETQFANGDVVTKGYDVKTGEVTPLANNPGELPEELPKPDNTGETRALIQPKNPTREDPEIIDDIYPGIDTNPLGTGSSTATTSPTSGPLDLHVATSSSYTAGSTPIIASSTQSVSDFTLDLTPPLALSPDIPNDLVVPAFIPNLQFVDVETTD